MTNKRNVAMQATTCMQLMSARETLGNFIFAKTMGNRVPLRDFPVKYLALNLSIESDLTRLLLLIAMLIRKRKEKYICRTIFPSRSVSTILSLSNMPFLKKAPYHTHLVLFLSKCGLS